MHKSLFYLVLLLGGLAAIPPVALTQPATQAEVEYIDPEILAQLQAIEPIDRSKLVPTAIQAIARRLSGSVTSITATTGSSTTMIPELAMAPENVVVIKGKSAKSAVTINGDRYPVGAPMDFVFGADGRLIKSTITIPKGQEGPSRLSR
jgi:hypothetical protein